VDKFIADALNGQPLTIFGTGKFLRTFTHYQKLTNAIIAAIDDSRFENRIVDISSGEHHSINEVADRISSIFPATLVSCRLADRLNEIEFSVMPDIDLKLLDSEYSDYTIASYASKCINGK
jgi:nucleoside-diphosphate-sugar epimerase